ncbi:hypothetical protein MVEN_02031000 [Mycena venus]|uniref:Uncharacterized protein n=1 Tax=Mycena venus TaxID=2733690 RepID=A0A8H7CJ15_9AGAR|nr:hypothetical protein MVEN_02031000 [Mycena venus]
MSGRYELNIFSRRTGSRASDDMYPPANILTQLSVPPFQHGIAAVFDGIERRLEIRISAPRHHLIIDSSSLFAGLDTAARSLVAPYNGGRIFVEKNVVLCEFCAQAVDLLG